MSLFHDYNPQGSLSTRDLYADDGAERPRNDFCRDFQMGTCKRSTCRFLHISPEEERIYKQTGKLPKKCSVFDRGSSLNKALEIPKPGSDDYMAAQQIASQDVLQWFKKFGYGTDTAYAAAYAASSVGYLMNAYYPALREKRRQVRDLQRMAQQNMMYS